MQELDTKQFLLDRKSDMAKDLIEISKIPSINPRMNGQGEYKRTLWIKNWLEALGLKTELFEVEDDAVPEGVRLNLLTRFEGTEDKQKTLWFIAHIDTVDKGDLAMWNTDPLDPIEKDGKIYGLGCEDNTQAVIAIMYIAKLMQETGLRAKCNVGFLFVSDEETGSKYGLHALIDKGLFSQYDEAVVPDGGSPEGDFIEIAEKSQVWLRFTTTGKQGHAAMPDLGINACSIGMHMGVEIEDTLKREFADLDPMFNPAGSTFELTQKFTNVSSPNVLPGEDIFVMDMRVLPKYKVDDVMAVIYGIMKQYERPGVTIKVDFITRVDAPPPTSPDSLVVQNLLASITETGVKARYGGIGGGTCAAILRAQGIPAVVWSNVDDMCHQPNEYVVVENIVKDAIVFASTIQKY